MGARVQKFDTRCPRKLPSAPQTFCPLAVQRLKALRHAGRELTEEEENALPGCPWAVNHQMANYCFFNFIDQFIPDDKPLSDMEIAHLLNISIESVKKIEKKALNRIRSSESFQEIRDEYGEDKVIDERASDTEWEIPR